MSYLANKWLCVNGKEDFIAEILFLILCDPHGASSDPFGGRYLHGVKPYMSPLKTLQQVRFQ